MDPFEIRIEFLSLLRKLNASQQSIEKVVHYARKYFSSCGEDLWDCIIEECQKGSINSRINILYLLDSLCEVSPGAKAQKGTASTSSYVDYISRDLPKVVELVVPEGRQGLPNLTSTKQVLDNWRTKRLIDPQRVDEAVSLLDSRGVPAPEEPPNSSSRPSSHLPRSEVLKRIEEDRERHKRLRERRWVQPVSQHSLIFPPSLTSFLPFTDELHGQEEDILPIEIEFENDWETTSDWNEDDDEAAAEETALCYFDDKDVPMDMS